jgi:small subunit ribosomal protein S9
MAVKLRKNTTKQKVVKKVAPIKVKTTGKVGQVARMMKVPAGNYFEGIGRRKVAVARVRIYATKGDFLVNGLAAGQYFDEVPNAQALYNKPMTLANLMGEFSITAKVSGSGSRSQLDAVILGIARALVKYDPELKTVLKTEGLLTRDDRMKETRKMGMGGKARRQRQSPKR